MNTAIGFTAIWRASPEQTTGAEKAIHKALANFTEIGRVNLRVGATTLYLWGRGEIKDSFHHLADGSLLALLGSPVGDFSLKSVEDGFIQKGNLKDFRLPWEGRVLLLYIDSTGDRWTIWNDWLGSIPVFHAGSARNRVASTLEPVIVAANRYTQNDFFIPGVISILTHGNLIGDWTIFKDMKIAPPDSVIVWDVNGVRSTPCNTIQASDERWECGWDDLVDEMHHLSRNAILSVLKTQPEWTVPLSSGLDSRLVAAVGAKTGASLHTYTWGPPTTRDVIHSRTIASTLGLPWKRIDLGQDYLAGHVQQWADLFGSAMHFHGMYQIPFLNALRTEPQARIISGFIGECLAGYDVRFQTEYHHPDRRTYYSHPDVYMFWDVQAIRKVCKFPVEEALEQLADEIEHQRNAVPGPWFQRLRFLTMWGRQRHFTYFQSMLSDYWFGAATPFVNREYARFCLSLPRAALDDRRMQIDMMRRYYAEVMCIPGTYAPEPAILTGRYLINRRLASILPNPVARRVLPEFHATKNIKTDILSLQAGGEKAIWPIPAVQPSIEALFDASEIKSSYQSAIEGDITSVRKIQSIQALSLRLLEID